MNKVELAKRLLTENETPKQNQFSEGHKIVVLQRGWVAIGQLSYNGDEGVLADASVIRRWGTTNGLGQLALEGKQSKTILEKTGTVRFKVGCEVLIIDVVSTKW